MKTDWDLKRDVVAELGWDPAVNAAAIGVAVQDGVVTLTGHIDTYAQKVAIARAVRRVADVKAIALGWMCGWRRTIGAATRRSPPAPNRP